MRRKQPFMYEAFDNNAVKREENVLIILKKIYKRNHFKDVPVTVHIRKIGQLK
jgi:hypothetical protein